MTIQFVDDVPAPQSERKWKVVLRQLRANPGHWAKVVEDAEDSQARSAYVSLKRFGCECVVRTDGGRQTCYARWPHPES